MSFKTWWNSNSNMWANCAYLCNEMGEAVLEILQSYWRYFNRDQVSFGKLIKRQLH